MHFFDIYFSILYSQDCATTALLAEPGFQLATVEFLLGGIGTEAASAPPCPLPRSLRPHRRRARACAPLTRAAAAR